MQLAAYAWLAEALGQPVTAGYFLIRQAQVHTERDEPFAGTAVAGSNLGRAWDRALHSYTVGLDAMQAGKFVATGVPEAADAQKDLDAADLLVRDPPCRFCEYRPLCGATIKGR